MIANLVHEWRTMPWTPRARRIGRVLESAGILMLIMAPVWAEGVVRLVLWP